MGKSKYWNWYGDDPMPEVAERYYDLLSDVNNAIPEELWDADKVPGVEIGRYWGYVSVYHICHDGPEDIHLDIDKDDNGKCTVTLCSLRDNGAKNFWDFPKKVHLKYQVPYKVIMDRDFAFSLLTLFAYSKKGYRKEIEKFITEKGSKDYED